MSSTLSAIMKQSLLVLAVVVAFGGGVSGKNIRPVREAARGVLDDPVALIEQEVVLPEIADPEVNVESGGDDLPLSFEQNLGQAEESVRFLARGARHRLLLSPGELTFVTRAASPFARSLTRLVFEGASAESPVQGIERLRGRVHYLTGSDPDAWLTDVPTFASVRYGRIYPGVDLTFRGTRQRISMEIRLAAGAYPDGIAFSLKDARGVEPAADGAIRILFGTGELRFGAPSAHQVIDGEVVEVEAAFAEPGFERFGLSLGEFDLETPLQVAVPITVLEETTAFRDDDPGVRVAVARSGHVFVAGQVLHAAVAPGQLGDAESEPRLRGEELGDAFVAKLDADGRTLVWSAYLGGEGEDVPRALALDPKGGVVISGSTRSERFPVTSALQPQLAGGADGFVARLLSDGSGFEYSTYLGTAGDDDASSVAVDPAGRVWISGTTNGTDFPISDDALQTTPGGGRDAFVARIARDGSLLEYASYLGGTGNDVAHAIALADGGEVVVVGATGSGDFPLVNAWQEERAGGRDAFATRFSADGSQVRFSTFLGGSGPDVAAAVALDAEGRVHVAGWTRSVDFPAPSHVLQPSTGSDAEKDGFVAGLEPDGTVVYATYLGGSADDRVTGIATDGARRVLVAGATRSDDFPLSGASRRERSGAMDAFVVELDAEGSELVEMSALGSSGSTVASGIALSPAGAVVVVGATSSREGLPANRLEPAGSGGDAFVASFEADSPTDLLACTINFIGADSTDPNRWDDGDNWDTGGIPGPSDTACISGTHYVYIYSTTEMVDAIEISGSGSLELNHSWGSLDIASASVVGGAGLILSGGTLTGAGDITFNGHLQFTSGHLEGTGDAIINGNLTMSTGTVRYLGRRLVNNSTAVLSYGSLHLDTGAIFDNEVGGTFGFQGDGIQVAYNSGSPQFNNRGTLLKSAGTGAAHIGHSILFINTGSVDVQVGTLEIRGMDATHSGSFDCTGATIDWWGDPAHTLDATSSLTGTEVIFSGADVTVLGTYDVDTTRIDSRFSTVTFDSVPTMNTLELVSGILTGTADIAPNGMITWNSGYMEGTGDTIVNNGMTISLSTVRYLDRRLENNSTTTFSYGGLQLRANAIFDNETGGAFDIQDDVNILWAGGSPQINNKGLFVKTAGAGTSTVGGAGVFFANTGNVEIRTGVLNLSATYTQTAGATTLNGGDLTRPVLDLDGGQLRGTGTVTGDVSISPGATCPGLSAGAITITGSYVQNASGSYDVEIGGVTPGTGYDRVDLTGAGSAALSGTLNVTLIGGFTPSAGDVFTIMTFPSRVGTFSGVNLPYLGSGFDWQMEYTTTAVILRVLASSPGTIPPTVEIDKSSITAGDLTITWDPSCSAGGIDARVYEGTLGSFNSHQAITCTDTGSDRTEDVTPASGDTYYVVVPVGVTSEGSYGADSTPTQRLPGSPGACTALPQSFSPCP